jgi:transcriptional regulator with XRE-family HTH domain
LLLPEEIKAIREKYNLTQTAFAKILGFGEKTIARYENGSIQDEAQNNLIELANIPNNFEVLLKKNASQLSSYEYNKAISALESYRPKVIIGCDEERINYSSKGKYEYFFGGFKYVG